MFTWFLRLVGVPKVFFTILAHIRLGAKMNVNMALQVDQNLKTFFTNWTLTGSLLRMKLHVQQQHTYLWSGVVAVIKWNMWTRPITIQAFWDSLFTIMICHHLAGYIIFIIRIIVFKWTKIPLQNKVWFGLCVMVVCTLLCDTRLRSKFTTSYGGRRAQIVSYLFSTSSDTHIFIFAG